MNLAAEKDHHLRREQGLWGSKLFYVVVLGAKGGIYFGWDLAEYALTGASETRHKVFDSWAQALNYYERHNDGRAKRYYVEDTPKWADRRIYPLPFSDDEELSGTEDEEDYSSNYKKPSARGGKLKTKAKIEEEGAKTTQTKIDGTFMGDDPSPTEGEAFGIRLLHDRYIAERLVHTEMSWEGQKELLQCMGDILALPTTPCASGDNNQSNLARVADSIQAVVATSNGIPMALSPSIS
eukprot:3457502-Ditylum_brightwellii.AAC.1